MTALQLSLRNFVISRIVISSLALTLHHICWRMCTYVRKRLLRLCIY